MFSIYLATIKYRYSITAITFSFEMAQLLNWVNYKNVIEQ